MRKWFGLQVKSYKESDGFGRSFYHAIGLVLVMFIILLGVYVFRFKGNPSGQPADFGTFGDYIGGVLNPFIAFLALLGLWQTNKKQVEMLQKQIEDERRRAKDAEERENRQYKEDAKRELINDFYRSFDAYIKATENIVFNSKMSISGKQAIAEYLNTNSIDLDGQLESIVITGGCNGIYSIDEDKFSPHWDRISILMNEVNEHTGSYFRLLFRAIKSQDEVEENLQKSHIYFLRAQLVESELMLIALNMLFTKKGRLDMSKYAEKYALLRHLRHPNLKRLVEIEFSNECFKPGKLEYH